MIIQNMKLKKGGEYSIEKHLSIYLLYYYIYDYAELYSTIDSINLSKLPDEIVLFYLLFMFAYSNTQKSFEEKISLSFCNYDDTFQSLFDKLTKLCNQQELVIRIRYEEFQIYKFLYNKIINQSDNNEIVNVLNDITNLLNKKRGDSRNSFEITCEDMNNFIIPLLQDVNNILVKQNITLPISSIYSNKNDISIIDEIPLKPSIKTSKCLAFRDQLRQEKLRPITGGKYSSKKKLNKIIAGSNNRIRKILKKYN